MPKPTVESTEIIDELMDEVSNVFVLPGIVNTPCIKSLSLNPTNKDILKKDFASLVNISTSETDAFVSRSLDLKIVCPIKFCGKPPGVMTSATITSLLINSELDGLIKLFSKSNIFASTPYKTLNNILIDSSTPFDW